MQCALSSVKCHDEAPWQSHNVQGRVRPLDAEHPFGLLLTFICKDQSGSQQAIQLTNSTTRGQRSSGKSFCWVFVLFWLAIALAATSHLPYTNPIASQPSIDDSPPGDTTSTSTPPPPTTAAARATKKVKGHTTKNLLEGYSGHLDPQNWALEDTFTTANPAILESMSLMEFATHFGVMQSGKKRGLIALHEKNKVPIFSPKVYFLSNPSSQNSTYIEYCKYGSAKFHPWQGKYRYGVCLGW